MDIKQLREKKELTQQEVANMIGVDVATYNRYERGKYKIGRTVQLALSVAFGVSVDEIKRE